MLNPPPPDPQAGYEMIGSLLVISTISTALFGVSLAQGCLYFNRHWQDSTRLKCIFAPARILEAINLAFTTHGMFVYTIIDRGDFAYLDGTLWTVPANLVVTLVQYVWVIRIRTLSKSPRRAQIAVAMHASIFIEAAWPILARTSVHWGTMTVVRWTCVTSLILRASNDIALTGLLCHYLQRSKNGLRETDSMIQTMIGYGLRAGLINCIGSITLALLVIIMPTKPYYVGIHSLTARFYANSLLAVLNQRREKSAELAGWQASEFSQAEVMELSSANWGTMGSQATRLTISDFHEM
ncbi:hypothetical protein PILCRDRAFT_810382 [Piloderma croceum F 1598]|uniref:DUF6534 domain-containing protein n=1 Tax=Piloderma croceum (strain F 1598) TaxID=765440 RepID=A0A0C3C0H5_PILCF|nr:hypothetical protein PILCRDRAFT_810382 [Piloderma croceum F 1598]